MKNYKFLFFDMDDTLIRTKSGKTFSEGIWDLDFNFDVLNKIIEMKPEFVFIVTNQGGIGKFISEDDFEAKFNYVIHTIRNYCKNDNVYGLYCATDDKNNEYRKPNIGMFRKINDTYLNGSVDVKFNSLMVGDASGKPGDFSDSDKKFAENAGIDYMDVDDFVKENA